jgi:hypothetical protein
VFPSGYRRNVEDTFIGPGGAIDRGFELDGKVREFWIQSGEGKGIFKKIEVQCLWYQDVTAPKTLVGSDIVFSCDAILIVRCADLPRRPLTNELLHHPRTTAWMIAEAVDVRGFYQIALNRASSS